MTIKNTSAHLCVMLAVVATVAFAQAPVTTSLWSISTSTSTYTSSFQPSPIVFNGTTILANNAYSSSNSGLNTLLCVNDTTGAVLWSTMTWMPVQFLTLRGTLIVAQTTSWVFAVSPQGALLWNVSANTQNYVLPSGTSATPVGPLLSTDSNTYYTYGVTTNSSNVFTVFAIDLTASAATVQLTPVFTTTSGYFNSNSNLKGAYLIPVNGSDFLFLFGYSTYYLTVTTANFSAANNWVLKGSCSYCYYTAPIVDPVNSVVYTAGGSYRVAVNDFVNGTQLATTATLNLNGTTSWSVYNLAATWGANGAVTGLAGFATTSSSYYDRSAFFQVTAYNGSSSLSVGTVVATSSTANYQNTVIGGDATNPNAIIAYVVDQKGNFGAFNVSSFTWLWTTPTVFQNYASSGGSYSDPTLRTSTFMNGKVYAVINGVLNGGTSRLNTFVALNPTTGAYTAQYTFSSSFSAMWLVSDLYTPLGESIVVYSSNAQLQSVLGTAVGTSTVVSSGAIATRVLYANGALYFGTVSGNLTCVSATNGSVLFVTTVIPASASNNFNPVLAPVMANGIVFMASNAYYSGNQWTVYVIANGGRGTVTAIARGTWATGCTSASSATAYGPLVVSPDQSYVYFAGGYGECVVQISTTSPFTASVSNSKNSNNVWATPLAVGNYVYSIDNPGYLWYARASSFSSTTLTITAKSSIGYYSSDFSYYNGQLYFTSGGAVYKYDGTLLAQQWTASAPSGMSIPSGYGIGAYSTGYSQYAPAGFFQGNVYTIVLNSSTYGVTAYSAAGKLIGTSTTTLWTTILPGATTQLTYPAISPDGIFVFANSAGVFAMTWTGAYMWSRTGLDCSDYTNYPRNFQIPTIRNGVVYVLCNYALHLMDLYRNGSDWQVGSTVTYTDSSQSPYYNGAAGVQFFVNPDPNSNQVVTITQSLVTVANVSGQLYTAAQLPAPLAPFDQTLLDEIKDNKLWIAGAVLGAVVVVIIIVVAKKMSGGGAAKKDTDYVTMSNMEKPVNAV